VDEPAGDLPRPIAERLHALRAMGFRFATQQGKTGGIVALMGVRAHHGIVDIVQLYGENDADAVRVPADEPDILFPRTVLWRTSGAAGRVMDDLMGLPDPAGTGRDPCGCWLPVQTGRLVWIAAPGRSGGDAWC
jgi:hypothetical protein